MIKTEIDQVIEVWQQYCERLFESDQTSQTNHEDCWTQSYEREPTILISEVRAAIHKLKSAKAAGDDAITAEALKFIGEEGVAIIHKICQNIWETGIWPDDWRMSVFIPLHKKGATNVYDNYRLLALISHASKIMLYILQTRLQHHISWQISPEQAGFVKGRSTREQILNLRQLIEKSREFYVLMYICFVDYSKAFNNVRWNKLWTLFLEMGTPKHLVFLIHRLHEENSAIVRINNIKSNKCAVRKGIRQGCVLFPLLFNIYSEYVMWYVLDDWQGGITMGGKKFSNLRFADDTTLFAATEEELMLLLDRLQSISLRFGLSINYNKSKIMIVDRANHNHPETRTITQCEIVNKMIYFGSIIDNNDCCEHEIRRRIQLAGSTMSQLTKVWRDRNIT